MTLIKGRTFNNFEGSLAMKGKLSVGAQGDTDGASILTTPDDIQFIVHNKGKGPKSQDPFPSYLKRIISPQ